MSKYIKENWKFLVLCLAFTGFSGLQNDEAFISVLIKVVIYLVVMPVCHYLFITKLEFDKSGPIPIHQSPIFWVGIPVLMVLIYVFV
jgi:hypothetical protein